jgi:dsRNA-specific ribonuclease
LRIEVIERAGGFAGRIIVLEGGTEKSTASYSYASSKKDAQHRASVSFLHMFLHDRLVPASETKLEEPPTQAPQSTDDVNSVGTLAELRMKHPEWKAPEYYFERHGPSHQAIIACTCVLNIGVRTLQTTARASNKKASKQFAAAQMLKVVEKEPASHEPPEDQLPAVQIEVVPADENYVGLLEELCTRRHISPRPIYGFDLAGPAHHPVVTCTAVVTVEGRQLSASGTATTKKVAKQVAACKLFRILEAAPPPPQEGASRPGPEENYVGRLIEMAQQHEDWSEPLFEVEASGASHQPVFTCTCSMQVGEDRLEAKGTAWQKQSARHSAARTMLELAMQRVVQTDADTSSGTTDEVSRLTALCLEKSLPLPRIAFEEWPNTAEPTYTCRTSIKIANQVHKASGVGSSKADALEAACRELLHIMNSIDPLNP